MGQRLVLNLRELRAQPCSTRDLSREVARQLAAMELDQVGQEQYDDSDRLVFAWPVWPIRGPERQV